MRAAVLLVLSALAGAIAAAPAPQAIFFVNNSIHIPGLDSFIQMDVFSSSPLKVLDSKVSSALDYVSGGVFCDGWYFAIGTNVAAQQAAVTYIDTLNQSSAVTVITPNLFHALACAPGSHTAPSPPHILAVASEYGPKYFLALFDVSTSVLTPLANFPATDIYLESDAGFIFTRNPLVAHAVFPKTDSSKHAPVYFTIDIASLAVTAFSFPLFEVSKPVFALPSPDGVVGLLQLGQYPDIAFEWFTGSASDGKLDIKHRAKTPLADYGGLSQAMVQCVEGGSLFGTLSTGTTNYDNVIVEIALSTGQVMRSVNTSSPEHPGLTAQAIACA